MRMRVATTAVAILCSTGACAAQGPPANLLGISTPRFNFEVYLGARRLLTSKRPVVVFCDRITAAALIDGGTLDEFLPVLVAKAVVDTECTSFDSLALRYQPSEGMLVVQSVEQRGDTLLIRAVGEFGGVSQKELARFTPGTPGFELILSEFTSEER